MTTIFFLFDLGFSQAQPPPVVFEPGAPTWTEPTRGITWQEPTRGITWGTTV